MSVREERKVKVPTCSLDVKTLRNFCKKIEDEITSIKLNEESKYKVQFILETKNKTITANTTEDFIESFKPKGITRIRIYHFGSLEIEINLDFGYFALCTISIEGNDSNKVDSLAIRLEEILKERKNYNFLFRTPMFLIPISSIFGFLLSFGGHMFHNIYLKKMPNAPFFTDNVFGFTFIFTIGLTFFFVWLFPHIEFENYMIQTRLRKAIMPIIIGVIITLIGSALWKIVAG